MVGLKQVAARAGVSVCTTSKILGQHPDQRRFSAETIARVQRSAAELGYRSNAHARALRTKRSGGIGLLGFCGQDLLAAEALGAVALALQNAPVHGVLVPGGSWEEQCSAAQELAEAGRCDALLVLAWGQTPESCARLRSAQLPVVALEGPAHLGWPQVATDHLQGCRLAVAHAVGLGHRHLAWLGPDHTHFDGQQRFLAVAAKAAEAGCHLDRICVPMGHNGQAEVQAATAEAWEAYVGEARGATALLCYHDQQALVAQQRCVAHGLRLPQDLSIIGHDNCLAPYGLPPLTSVAFGFSDCAQVALQLLQTFMSGAPPEPSLQWCEPRLIVRASTCAPCT